MQTKPGDYRELVRQELARRTAANPAYSLRAFARDLNIKEPPLWRFLHGKQHLSHLSARKVAEALYRTPREKEYFIALFELATTREQSMRCILENKIQRLDPREERLKLDQARIESLSEWHHVAVMDLTALKGYSNNPAKIAKALGIELRQVTNALDKLVACKLLMLESGHYRKTHWQIVTPTDIPSASLRKFHRQMISRSLESLESQSTDQRYISGQTLTIDRQDLPKFKSLVTEFFKEARNLARSREKKDALYQINVQLFDLANGDDRKVQS